MRGANDVGERSGGHRETLVEENVRGLKGMSVELSWWEWALFRFAVLLITTPAVVVAVYLIFRKRGP